MPKQKKLYRIGELAEFVDVSVQTLRYYEKIDLIKPEFIDPETKYRYYSEDQLGAILSIKNFKLFGFTLNDIKEFFALKDVDEVVTQYRKKIKEFKKRIQRLKDYEERFSYCLKIIKTGLRKIKQSSRSLELKVMPERIVLSCRRKLPNNLSSKLLLHNELLKMIYANKLRVKNSYSFVYHDPDYINQDQNSCDIELCVALKSIPLTIFENKNINQFIRTIPAGVYLSSIVHGGGFENSVKNHQEMEQWLLSNHYKKTGPVIHYFLISLAEAKSMENILYEVQIPVEKIQL